MTASLSACDPVAKIKSIASLPELDSYEAEAKRRGITTDEIAALHQKRVSLTPKKRGKK